MYNFFEESGRLLQEAGKIGQIDPAVLELLSEPMRVVSFRLPLRMDDGSRQIFQAYRAHHNAALGPCRDGTRVSLDLDLGEVKALSMLMSIKHAAGNIPAGGGKGGIVADPHALSKWEYERLCRAYIRNLRPSGPDYDVPGADIGTDLQTMSWMLDEFEQLTGRHNPPAINDKPPILRGSFGGYEATGRGVFDATAAAAKIQGLDLSGATVAVQGFGQVGSVAALMLAEAGAKIIAVSDSRHGVYNPKGLDVSALLKHKTQTKSVKDFTDSDSISNADLLELNCDILVPAALQGVISEDNANRIRPKLLVEAANAPTTIAADKIIQDNGINIVPDVIANSGSVHVCQMERSQGLYDNRWPVEKINKLRHERLVGAYHEAVATAERHQTGSVRMGAWINAIERMQEAILMRGWL